MTTATDAKLLTTKQAAKRAKLKPHHMANLRSKGLGPIYLKIGARVYYRAKDIDAWAEKQVRVIVPTPKRRAG